MSGCAEESVLILGATSEIAQALARRLAASGRPLILAGRNEDAVRSQAADLEIRFGIRCRVEVFEASAFDEHAALVQRCVDAAEGRLMGIVACQGYLPDPRVAAVDPAVVRQTIDVNLTSVVSCFSAATPYFEGRRCGFLAAISSVAGDRGRQSNYLYGMSKAGLNSYLQGLRNRLFQSGVHVLTIKPGFVDTAMTHGMINPRSPLVASPDRVARDIDRAIRRRRNVIYTPWFWWGIMAVIKSIPECIFKRLSL